MARKRFLTELNKRRLHDFLRSYLLEVYGEREHLTPSLVTDWLNGLPLSVSYTTHNIVCMLLGAVTGSKDYSKINEFITNASEIDSFYWEEMGRIIYYEGME